MAISKDVLEKGLQNEVIRGVNGDGGLFAEDVRATLKNTLEAVQLDDQTKQKTTAGYKPMTTAEIENTARERAVKSVVGKINDELHTAKTVGDDTGNMLEILFDMALGDGRKGGGTMGMIVSIFKGESPFWKTVKETLTGDTKLASFTDKWKDNIQEKALATYAEKHGIPKEELVATLSSLRASDILLAKVQEQDPAQAADQQKKLLDTAIDNARENATIKARLKFEEEQAGVTERRRLEGLQAGGQQSVTNNGDDKGTSGHSSNGQNDRINAEEKKNGKNGATTNENLDPATGQIISGLQNAQKDFVRVASNMTNVEGHEFGPPTHKNAKGGSNIELT